MVGNNQDPFREQLRQFEQNVASEIEKRLSFIRQVVEEAGARGVVVGISGGLDSAVCAALCLKALGPDKVKGIWMPAHSQPVHQQDAEALSRAIGLPLWTVDVSAAYDVLVAEIEKVQPLGDLSRGNTKARMRMATLYAIANQLGYLVADTCNRSELYVGYVTKGGDGVADFGPMSSLTKHHVQILARHLGIPESILKKPPSADLWAGQTDEQEMGFTYEELDRYLLTGEGSPEVIAKIEKLHQNSEHKRRPMPAI